MEEKIMNKRKLNNAGLTLVEILVAVAIFSIAIVPLMYGFVFSAMNNAKAKHLQQTSTLAYTIIENCKAYTMEEIEEKVADGSFMPDAAASFDASVVGDPTKVFYFNDVNMYESDEHGDTSTQVYDIKMTVTPMGAEQDMMQYNNMNKYKDAIFMAESTQSLGASPTTARQLEDGLYAWVLGLIKAKVESDATAVPLTEADIENSMATGGKNAGLQITFTRDIILNTYVNAGGEGAEVTYEYTYNLNQDFKYDSIDLSVPGGIVEKSVDCNSTATLGGMFRIYDSSLTTDNLQNVYLFYYPPYNNQGIKCISESIELNNNLGRDLNVYLLKQVKTDMSMLEIKSNENLYNPNIHSGSMGGDIILYHNLLTNIGGGSVVSWNPASVMSSVIELVDFDPDAGVEPLVAKDSKQLMYKVLVEVFDRKSYQEIGGVKQMTTASLADMDGTFLNW